MANFEKYMESQPRALLTEASNNGTSTNPPHPLSDDAGNWDGCREGSGSLIGTYRDVSACALKAYLGRPITEQDLLNLSKQDVYNIFRTYWDGAGAGSIPSQEVANIYMHIKLHYGNVRVVQKALNALGENLSVDGVPGPQTKEAIVRQTKKDPGKTYNEIRKQLWDNYSQNPPQYREAFLNIIRNYFPEMEEGSSTGTSSLKWYHYLIIGISVLIIGFVIFKIAKK